MAEIAYDIKLVLPVCSKSPLGAALPKGALHYTVRFSSDSNASQSYTISIPKKVCTKLRPLLDESMPLELLREIIASVCESGAKDRALELLNRKAYLSTELRSRLTEEGFEQAAIDNALQFLSEYSCIDDELYLRNFIEGKVYAGWGLKKIELHLRKKGVPAQSYKPLLEECLSKDTQLEKALRTLERKGYSQRSDYPKMYRHLTQKGHPQDIAYQAIMRYLEGIS